MTTSNSSKITASILTICFCVLSMSAGASQPDHFRKYIYPTEGFEVSFPSKPLEFRTENKLGSGYSNSYQAVVINPISQYSIFVQHSHDKVFSDESIDAYFNGIVRGLMLGSDNPDLKYTKRTRLIGLSAIEYQYAHTIEGIPVIGRGIVVMVDGNHIRLSQIYTENEMDADKNFKKFVQSFRLTPIDGPLSTRRFDDKSRGIAFSPPDGWKQDTTKFAQIPAIFMSPAGHMLQITDSSTAGYTCNNYKQEIQTLQGIQATGVIEIRGRFMIWIKSTAYNPSAKIRMTSIYYCLNTSRGAVILDGSAPEETFIRSEAIFEKVAKTLVARK